MKKYSFTAEKLAVLERMPQPLAVYQFVDRRVVTLALSDGFCELFGFRDRAQAYHEMDNDMYRDDHPDDVARIANAGIRFATEGGTYDVIYRTRNRAGEGYRVVHATGWHVMEEGVQLAYITYTDEGLYEEQTAAEGSSFNRSLYNALHEESLLKASRYDYLTGLPSMTYFFELAEAGKEAMDNRGDGTALLFLDLNGMKYFNTRYSFAEGDRLLKSFASLLARSFSNENCCRVGGDHFTVFTGAEGLEDRLRQLFEACRDLNGGNSLPVKAGIYAPWPAGVSVSTACDRAKLACDAMKNTYESGMSFYDSRLRNDAEKRQYFLTHLDRAIEERWIQVYYQPLVRSVNGRVCGEEALARWIDPKEGFLSPGDFIPHLEAAGLIYKLDLFVVEQVLEKIRLQMESGLFIVPHSVNLSRSDFDACDMVEEIRARVDGAGIPRDKITIEITESIIGSDFQFMKTQVERFRSLGFPVWMDDFGSGYSSLDLLQSIRFDLIKFDMSFMRKLDEGESGKIILTELMKMATALGVDTLCEGVETESQVRFLREIGCSRQQGFYYCRAVPLETILERYQKGIQIGYENPEEADYFDGMGRVNLFDLAVIANGDDDAFHHFFNTLPMCIIEVKGDTARFVRSNQSYRDFIRRFFGFDISYQGTSFARYDDSFMHKVVKNCCEQDSRLFFDEKMPDGALVHTFARRIGVNPVTGTIAVAIAILSVAEPDAGTTYADIARALAADYYNIYYVDLESEDFIEYSSQAGAEELAEERHGENFFCAAREATLTRIYAEDRDSFLAAFTRENVLRELQQQGVFSLTYRLTDTGEPVYVNMKVTRMQPDGGRIIIGISRVDAQMKRQEEEERLRQESVTFGRIAALSGNFLAMYTVDPATGHYYESSASRAFEKYGLAKEGECFFCQMTRNVPDTVHPEDCELFLRVATRENVMREIRENGLFSLNYRLMLNGRSVPVSLRAALVQEQDGEKLIVGINSMEKRTETA